MMLNNMILGEKLVVLILSTGENAKPVKMFDRFKKYQTGWVPVTPVFTIVHFLPVDSFLPPESSHLDSYNLTLLNVVFE